MTNNMVDTVNKFLDAFERRSTDECLACFKPSDSIMVYGTASDEKRIGIEALREQLDRNWSQSLSASLQITWHTSMAYENNGWVAADFTGRFRTPDAEGERKIRGTFVPSVHLLNRPKGRSGPPPSGHREMRGACG